MDPLILKRLERLCQRFTGIDIQLEVLDETPIWFVRPRRVWDRSLLKLTFRFSRQWGFLERLNSVAATAFVFGVDEWVRQQIAEDRYLPEKYDVERVFAGAYLAEVASTLGTRHELDVKTAWAGGKGLFKAEKIAGSLFLMAGAFGWRPFYEVSEDAVSERSAFDPAVREKLERLLEEVEE